MINQTFCLQNDSGHRHMPNYDVLPASVRARLRTSTFNICVACLIQCAGIFATEMELLSTIEQMEREIACQRTP